MDSSSPVEEILIDSNDIQDHAEAFKWDGGAFVNFVNITRFGGAVGSNYALFIDNIDGITGDEIGISARDGSSNKIVQVMRNNTYTSLFNFSEDGISGIHDEMGLADFDEDGLLDLVTSGSSDNVTVSNSSNQEVIFTNKPSSINGNAQAFAIGDFNNETCWDIAGGTTGGTGDAETAAL